MKKGFWLLILVLLLIPFGVYAATVDVTMSCPDSANASSEISCTITAKPNGSNLKGIQANFEISGGTYSSFAAGSGWIPYSSSNKGISLQRSEATNTSTTVGTLKVKMPSSGNAVVNLTNIAGTDSNYATLTSGNVSKTIRIKSTVNTLDSLIISGATINFDKNTTTYNVTVDSASTTISAVKTDQYSTMTGTGSKTLKYGKNTFTVVVTSESGVKKTYTVNITRPDNRSTNNNLSSLKSSSGTINFNKATTTYNLSVEKDVSKIKVTATLEDSKATFVNGFGSREVSLNYGKNTIQIKVKAENEVEKTYTIYVTRKDDRSSNTYLSEITLSSGKITFNKEQTEYKIVVENDIEELKISAKAEDAKSKLEYTETNKLVIGDNTINIKVTAENETTKTYKLIVTRKEKGQELDDNNYLSLIVIKDYTLDFDKDTLNYNLKIKDEEKLDITVTTESKKATATIVGNENLKNGSKIRVNVTSESGKVKEYVINIEKETEKQSAPANIKSNNSNTMLYIGIGVFSVGLISFILVLFKKKKKKNYN